MKFDRLTTPFVKIAALWLATGFMPSDAGAQIAPPWQSISVEVLRARGVTEGPFQIQATATSGLPLNFELLTGPATLSGNGSVTLTGEPGTVTLKIHQTGGGGYDPAQILTGFQVKAQPFFTQVSTGGGTAMALKTDGSLWGWGVGIRGEIGNGSTANPPRPVPAGGAAGWKAVSQGGFHTLGIQNDGSLWGWGTNDRGQLGSDASANEHIPIRIGSGADWSLVAARNSVSAAIQQDGTLWTWGSNVSGQLGDGTGLDRAEPAQVGVDAGWVEVSMGTDHVAARRADGSLWAWGNNGGGRLGDGTVENRTLPVRVGTAAYWAIVSAGFSHTLALRQDGTLWSWGTNTRGELGDGGTTARPAPAQVGTSENWVAVAAGANLSLALRKDGSLWSWGLTLAGNYGMNPASNSTPFNSVPEQIGEAAHWISIASAGYQAVAVSSLGEVQSWGSMAHTGFSDAPLTRTPVRERPWSRISAGYYHSLALDGNGALWAWGNNISGQVGDGTRTIRYVPVRIGTDSDWKEVSAGGSPDTEGQGHSLALKQDGSLWAWGFNAYSQIGDGTTPNRLSPVRIGMDTNWKTVSAGGLFSAALREDGTLWTWGMSSAIGRSGVSGQPAKVGTATHWTAVSLGNSHGAALTSTGELWSWGAESVYLGRAGSNGGVPGRVGTAADVWKSVSVGSRFTAALKADGSLWSWGNNTYGQLGTGVVDASTVLRPVRAGQENNWMAIAAGHRFMTALRRDGSLWSWGDNALGQLGDGTVASKLSPAKVGMDQDWETLENGGGHGFTRRADGSVWGSGTNEHGRRAAYPFIHGKSTQSLSLIPPVNLPMGQAVPLVASAGSGHPVSWKVTGPATVAGQEITRTGAGEVRLVVWQEGDEVWQRTSALFLYSTESPGSFQLTHDGPGGAGPMVFGSLPPGPLMTRTVIVKNDGGGPISGISIGITGAAAGQYQLIGGPFPETLSPGHSFAVVIGFHPWVTGTHEADLNITGVPGTMSLALNATVVPAPGPDQTITCPALLCPRLGSAPFQIQAWSGSGLPLTFTAVGSAASVTAQGLVTVGTTAGRVEVTVAQSGGGGYQPASARLILMVGQNPATTRAVIRNGDELWSLAASPAVMITGSWAALSGNSTHTMALRTDGTLWGYGTNTSGQLGDGTLTTRETPVEVAGGGNDWAAVSAGRQHTLALRRDGSLWAWGIHQPNIISQNIPLRIATASDWTFISAGSGFSAGIRQDGSLWTWGVNGNGQLGDGSQISRAIPVRVGSDNNWAAVSAGGNYTLALRQDGSLWAWGSNQYQKMGVEGTTASLVPVRVGEARDWVMVAAGYDSNSAALKSGGGVWVWGNNLYSQLGFPGPFDVPVSTPLAPDRQWSGVAVGDRFFVGLDRDGAAWSWGTIETVGRGAGPQLLDPSVWKNLAIATDQALLTRPDGSLWAIGSNTNGVHGTGTLNPSQVLAQSGTAQDWSEIDVSYSHAAGIRNDGSLWTWGSNASGQLGDGTTEARLSPVRVGSENDWSQVKTGSGFTMATKTDGSLRVWGYNADGYLGDGSSGDRLSPSRIGTGVDWSGISAGGGHLLALRGNGALWSWGLNSDGQVGDGIFENRLSPFQIGTLSGWSQVSAGTYHSLAIHGNGTMWAWGYSLTGQIGDGLNEIRRLPVQIGTERPWASVSAGDSHSAAIARDGTLWTWGYNREFMLGRTGPNYLPGRAGTGHSWRTVRAGVTTTLMLRRDGTLWGNGAYWPASLRRYVTPAQILPLPPVAVITFPQLPPLPMGTPVTLAASASNGLPVVLHASGPAGLIGNVITRTGPGAVFVTAWQPGETGQEADPVVRLKNDGPLSSYQAWAQEQQQIPVGYQAPEDDPDSDGVPNLLEYSFATPALAAGGPGQPQWTFQEGVWSIGFTRPAQAESTLYTAEWNEDLTGTAGEWQPLPNLATPPLYRFEFPINPARSRAFLRIRATLQ